MTAATTTLNVGTGGDKVLTDTLTTVDGGAAPTSAIAQMVKVGSGAAGTFSTASVSTPLPTQLAALYYPASTGNNTTTQLAASATFTGAIETIQNQQAAQITIVCDQAYTLHIKQYIDSGGTKLISDDVFTMTAGTPFSQNVSLPGNYFNLTITNNSGTTATTTLTCDVTFGVMDTAPRTVSPLGNLRGSINEVNGTALALGQAAMAASLPVAIASNQSSIPVAATISGAGRAYINLWASGAAAGATGVETAITLTRSGSPGATNTTGTSFTPTSGKRFRITSITFGSRGNATATAQVTAFTLRVNTAGAVTTTSAAVVSHRTATPATALAWDRFIMPLPMDGIEILGDGTVQFGVTAAATFTTNAPTWDVLITGYEY